MEKFKKYKNEIEDFLWVCKMLSKRLYVTSHGGNLSRRLEDDLLLITPTKMYKESIEAEDLVFIDLDGNVVEGKNKPSGETPMYLNFFKERPDIKSVVHSHPPVTNAFAINEGENWLMRPVFPETVVEVGPVPVVPWGEPITQQLADNFKPFLQRYNTFLMENHGLVIMTSEDIVRAFHLTDILEVSAISILNALSFDGVREISKENVIGLENTRRTRKLPSIGNPELDLSFVDLYFAKADS